MSGANETKFLVQHQSCENRCRLNESACNTKQIWNHDECWCECKESDDWGSCKNNYMWNPCSSSPALIAIFSKIILHLV